MDQFPEPRQSKPRRRVWQWLLPLCILLLIGAGLTGYYLVSGKKEVSTQSQQNEQQDAQGSGSKEAAPSKAKNVLKITQWGVEFTLSDELTDLGYEIQQPDVPIAYFSTDSLTALDVNCSAKQGPVGAISRENAKRDPNEPQGEASYIKIGPYYYYLGSPQAYCSDKQSAQDLAAKQLAAMKKAFETLKASQ